MLGRTSFALIVTALALVAGAGSARATTHATAADKGRATATGKGHAGNAGKTPAGRKKGRAKRPQAVTLVAVNTHENFTLRPADAKGRPPKALQKRFDRFLRCHYTGAQHKMNPRLIKLLWETGQRWPGRRLEVVSGYRHPKFAKNPRSPHKKGLACDFRIEGVKNTELRDYLRSKFAKVGVGYYPNSSFVHLDVRDQASAFWIDYSGPGERAQYSRNAADDLKNGRAESWKPAKIPADWADGDAENDHDDDAPPGSSDRAQAGGGASGSKSE